MTGILDEKQPVPLTTVPDGFTLHSEGSAQILLPSTVDAFLNPVQQFNRDISVAVISTFGDALARDKEARYNLSQKRKAQKKTKHVIPTAGEAGDEHREVTMVDADVFGHGVVDDGAAEREIQAGSHVRIQPLVFLACTSKQENSSFHQS